MILKNMTVKEASRSKGMLGGALVIGVGVFLLSKGQYEMGAAQIGVGLSLMGIRDAQ